MDVVLEKSAEGEEKMNTTEEEARCFVADGRGQAVLIHNRWVK